MKSFLTAIPLFLACFSFTGSKMLAQPISRSELPSQDSLHLFLLVGQSNMAGRGEVSAGDREVNPRILALNANGDWVYAVDPIHWDKPVAGVGLARSFAVEYLKDHPGVTVGFIPAACGGSPISAWMPGAFFEQTNSNPYDDAISRTRLAEKDGTLKGILWHQGESDCHAGLAEVYEEALRGLIARFRADLDAPDVPVVLGQLGKFEQSPWGEQTHMVDAATRRVAENSPLVGIAVSDGLTCKSDGIHFNSGALHEFGKRYYAVYKLTGTAGAH